MQQELTVPFKVRTFLEQHNLLEKTFIVGFSGGYDSLCLLDILTKLNIKVIAAHFNHKWRKDADIEEINCKNFCNQKNIIFYSENADNSIKKTENDARIARYEFFSRVKTLYNADGIFTAHNANDNAETLIYRITKGTGIKGLKGISPIRDDIYRPLLECSRDEIENYCKQNSLSPNNDSSNFDTKYKRNLIRHNVLPQLQSINQNVVNAINTLSEIATQEEEIVEEYLHILAKDIIKNDTIKTQAFLSLSSAVRTRLLYNFLSTKLDEYDFSKVNEIYEYIIANVSETRAKKISLTTNLELSINNSDIFIYSTLQNKPSENIKISSLGEYIFQNYTLTLEECTTKPSKYPSDEKGIAYIEINLEKSPLELRYGKPSDKISPYGMQGEMNLKKYLSGRKIPQHLRLKTIVLAQDEQILWVPFVGLSNNIAIKTNPTHIISIKENS